MELVAGTVGVQSSPATGVDIKSEHAKFDRFRESGALEFISKLRTTIPFFESGLAVYLHCDCASRIPIHAVGRYVRRYRREMGSLSR